MSGVDLRAIEQVLYRYCAGVDRKDWDLVRSCYEPGAHDDHGNFSGPVEEFVPWLADRHERVLQSFHAITGVRLVDEAPGAALTESLCLVRQVLDRGADREPFRIFLGCRYLDLFREHEDGWRVAHREVTYDWVEEVARGREMLVGTELPPTERDSSRLVAARRRLHATGG
ncbi:MAG TPA: nuclear transport factor 2 family protein [Acidimicrobiales bacterium]